MEIQLLNKPLQKGEELALANIWERSVAASHDFLSPEYFVELRNNFIPVYLKAVKEVWIARKACAVCGFMGCNDVNVEMLFVHPDFWRQGVGAALLAKARSLYGKLRIFVNEQNSAAIKFYESQGFCLAGRKDLDDNGRPYPLLEFVG